MDKALADFALLSEQKAKQAMEMAQIQENLDNAEKEISVSSDLPLVSQSLTIYIYM